MYSNSILFHFMKYLYKSIKLKFSGFRLIVTEPISREKKHLATIFARQKMTAGAQWRDWRWQLQNSFVDLKQLEMFFEKEKLFEDLFEIEKQYPLRVNPYYLSLIESFELNDPILMQILPHKDEAISFNHISEDPLEEEQYSPVPGLVHRYPDRALAIMTGFCATLCRHCMRKRNWLEPEAAAAKDDLRRMAEYIRKTPKIREVLITGGDPLLINIELLDWFMGELRTIPSVEIIRIGTRVPVVIPQRINEEMCSMLEKHSPVWVATHFNHSQEITTEAAEAADRMLRHGIPVINQTVLMKGINNDLEIIRKLCTDLLRIKIKPYYLFHGDPVKGTVHFRTGVEEGLEIMRGLRGHTSSLAVPTFAIDLPGGGGKVPLLPNYVIEEQKEGTVYQSFDGRKVLYKD